MLGEFAAVLSAQAKDLNDHTIDEYYARKHVLYKISVRELEQIYIQTDHPTFVDLDMQ